MADATPEPTVWQRLAASLPKDEIRLRVGRVTPKGQQVPYSDGTKADFLAYHDARHVMDRLDEVVGPERWRDEYTEVVGAVACRLSVLVEMPEGHFEWVHKEDVGYPNNPSKPEPEALKSAYSDALKRAGVKWGIGRYLYSLPQSGWWPVNKWGELSKADEAKLRARMFDGLAVEPPAEDAQTPADARSDTPAPTGPEADAAPAKDGMSDEQRKLIQVLAKKCGFGTEALHGLMMIEVGKSSGKELTKADASKVIDALMRQEQRTAGPDE